MADLVDSILGNKKQEIYARNPYLVTTQAIAQDETPITDPKAAAVYNLSKALTGGLSYGYGIKSADNDYIQAQQELANISQQYGYDPNKLVNALSGSANWRELAGPYAWQQSQDAMERRKKLEDYAQQTGIGEAIKFSYTPESRFMEQYRTGQQPTDQATSQPIGRNQGLTQMIGDYVQQGLSFDKAQDRAIKMLGATPQEEENRIFNEISKSAPFKNMQDVIPLLETMESANKQRTRAADISFIAAFARINDPGSTVREGEVKLSENAAPWIASLLQKAKSETVGGGLLTQGTREEILNISRAKVGAFVDAYNSLAKSYTGIGQRRYGEDVNVDNMLPQRIQVKKPFVGDYSVERFGSPEQARDAYIEAVRGWNESNQ